MAELSPALESVFTATETAFPPLQSTIKPAVSRPLNSQTGRFCPRPMHPQARRGDALRVASPPFISLQASLDQPASPPDRPSFLLGGGKRTAQRPRIYEARPRTPRFSAGSAGLGIGSRCFRSGLACRKGAAEGEAVCWAQPRPPARKTSHFISSPGSAAQWGALGEHLPPSHIPVRVSSAEGGSRDCRPRNGSHMGKMVFRPKCISKMRMGPAAGRPRSRHTLLREGAHTHGRRAHARASPRC